MGEPEQLGRRVVGKPEYVEPVYDIGFHAVFTEVPVTDPVEVAAIEARGFRSAAESLRDEGALLAWWQAQTPDMHLDMGVASRLADYLESLSTQPVDNIHPLARAERAVIEAARAAVGSWRRRVEEPPSGVRFVEPMRALAAAVDALPQPAGEGSDG